MKLLLTQQSPSRADASLLVLPLRQTPNDRRSEAKAKKDLLSRLAPESKRLLESLDAAHGKALTKAAARHELTPAAGKRLTVPVGEPRAKGPRSIRLSAVGSGDEADEWRKLGADAVRAARSERAETVAIVLPELDDPAPVVRAVAEGVVLGGYEYRHYKSKPEKSSAALPSTVELLTAERVSKELRQALEEGRETASAVCYSRDLVNTPGTDLPPSALVQAAKKLAQSSKGKVKLKVLDRKALERLDAGALLGVARGSDTPPYLIHLSLAGKGGKKRRRIALVGKGVTFDSGGLSIKTRPGMEDMKCDMAGAAAVLGTLKALLDAGRTLPFDLEVIVPTSENMINGNSVKPGDVLRAMNGTTIEVLNTDAEGRLLLADAFCYAEKLKPDVMIDLATLTGACIAAIGSNYAGLFTDDRELAEALTDASSRAGEKLWELPLAKEYRGLIEGSVADLKNSAGAGPGAITAALFLKEFVPEGCRWAHLDIAGPAFLDKPSDYAPKGATGFGVRTLFYFLQNLH